MANDQLYSHNYELEPKRDLHGNTITGYIYEEDKTSHVVVRLLDALKKRIKITKH